MESEKTQTQALEEDTFKILVATDIHLGYKERDPIRGEDSFIAFEEILQSAVERDVDFILLGGDLFDETHPSQNTLHKCITLLRRYTLGDKPIEIELLSDQSVNFAESLNRGVNYEDPNVNISIPVFSIHGNHDDPSGFGLLSSLDLLAVSGLVNYFGKWVDLTKINLSPILMKKGETQLALYGLSHIHDNRLFRLFRESKVVVEKPDESTGVWFNLMVLHQNRVDRGPKNYVPEEILPNFFNLVIWGHEHDCHILPEQSPKRDFHVSQPGSSVATSLSEGEALQKHCAELLIHKNGFQILPIPLKTVRPFIFESIDITNYIEEYGLDEVDASEKVMEIAKETIEEMISRANEKLTGDPRQPKLPLIRLRICYTNESQMFNGIRFGQQFTTRVANPADIILFKRAIKKCKVKNEEFDKYKMDEVLKQEDIDHETKVEEVIDRYFEEVDESKKLKLMSSKILSVMCESYIRRDDDAADNVIKFCKKIANEFLVENFPEENELEVCIAKFKSKSDALYGQVLKMLDERGSNKKTAATSFLNDTINDENDGDNSIEKASSSRQVETQGTKNTRGRGRGRGRGSRGGTSSAAGGRMNATQKAELNISKTGNRQSTLSNMLRKTTKTTTINYIELSDSE